MARTSSRMQLTTHLRSLTDAARNALRPVHTEPAAPAEALERLRALADARTGLPITSHRTIAGPAVVAAKELFRHSFQPFINEALRKQSEFNSALIRWADEVNARIGALETAAAKKAAEEEARRLAEEAAKKAAEEAARKAAEEARKAAEEAVKTVVVELPVELLFTEDGGGDVPSRSDAWHIIHSAWADHPITALMPHVSLYEFLLGRRGYPTEYVEWFEAIHTTRGTPVPVDAPTLIEKRYFEFEVMERSFVSGDGFFRALPVKVVFNRRGYFNIKDGHHRASYLVARGARRVWCELAREDLAQWEGSEAVRDRLADWLATKPKEPRTYTPLLVPGFLERPAYRDHTAMSRMDRILRYLGPTKVRGKRVLDIGSNIGFYAQQFSRMGAVVTGVEPDLAHGELSNLLMEACGVSYTLIQQPFEELELPRHHIAVMLTVLYHFLPNPEKTEQFLAGIRRSVGEMLFWESGADAEREKELIRSKTHLTGYTQLGFTYGTGKARELGVFFAERK